MSICHNCLFRLFIRELLENVLTFTAGIRPTLETSGYLPHFLALKDKNIDWDVVRVEYTVKNSDLPVKYLELPRKKRKIK